MPYLKNQTSKTTREPNMTADKLAIYRKFKIDSHEPQGETMNEQQMTNKPNQPGSGLDKTKKPFTQKVTNFIKKGLQNIDRNMKSNPVGTSINVNSSHEPEGEVIKENETENPTFVQFMKRIDQLPEVTREAIKNCGNDPAIAKAALEISGIDK